MRDREARGVIKQLLDELIADYAVDGRGVEIREIAGGYRMATKPECHDAVRHFIKELKPPLKLSLPALETLAVIAYKQPVTAPEVNEIRGVDSSAVFGSLLARKLIATAGRKQVIGRPILYKTTREFLLRFGLKDVSELPSMEEFEKMAASELDEAEMASGESATAEAAAEFNPDLSTETNIETNGNRREPPVRNRDAVHTKPLPMRQPATRSEQKVTGFPMTIEKKTKPAAPAAKSASKTKKADTASKKPAAKSKTASPKTAKSAAKTAAPAKKRATVAKKAPAQAKAPAAKSKKRAATAEKEAATRLNEPVLDPIGDVTSGEAHKYLGDVKDLANLEAEEARAKTAPLEAGPGMTAAAQASQAEDADGESEADSEEEESGIAKKPRPAANPREAAEDSFAGGHCQPASRRRDDCCRARGGEWQGSDDSLAARPISGAITSASMASCCRAQSAIATLCSTSRGATSPR